jgi:dipeptidyl aminopeptidase/acylaminoacyl peptidase
MAGQVSWGAQSLAVLGLAFALSAMPVAAAEPVSLEALFGKPALGAVALSPSGRYLAITVPGKNALLELRVADLDVKPWNFRGVAWLRDLDVGAVDWVNDKRIVFQAFDSQSGAWGGTCGLWAVDADGENRKLLIDAEYLHRFGNDVITLKSGVLELGAEWQLERVLPGDGDDVLIREWHWSSVRGSQYWTLARLNTRARIPKPLYLTSSAPDGAQQWITDRRGVPQYMQGWVDGQDKVFHRAAEDRWEEIASFADTGDAGWRPRFLLYDTLLVSTQPPGASAAVLTALDPATGKLAPTPVLAAKGFDVGATARPIVDEESDRLLGWRYRLDTLYTRWGDEGMKRFQAAIDRALPGKVNLIACRRCGSAKRWLVESLSDREPPQYAVFEPGSGRLTPVGSEYPDIPGGQTGARSMERIQARDGLEIPAYVTRPFRPAGSPPGPLPAVVYVHGGPSARTNLEWSELPVPQFLASRGYVVIEPDFRGSAGYGVKHSRAGRGQWGLAMQDDLSDVLHWAIEKGLVDKGRVCIMGASYGGYAALMGPVRDPTAYRCAISWVGVTDLPRLLRDAAQTHVLFEGLSARILRRELGDPQKDAEKLQRTSPAFRAADIKVPVLAAWGKDDQRVPLEHGRRFRDAAAKAGVELEYVEYADEGHSWLRPATWIDFMGRAEKLLARTLGPAR